MSSTYNIKVALHYLKQVDFRLKEAYLLVPIDRINDFGKHLSIIAIVHLLRRLIYYQFICSCLQRLYPFIFMFLQSFQQLHHLLTIEPFEVIRPLDYRLVHDLLVLRVLACLMRPTHISKHKNMMILLFEDGVLVLLGVLLTVAETLPILIEGVAALGTAPVLHGVFFHLLLLLLQALH